MEAIITYSVKVILISAILSGYYFFVLRNKHFHAYNRFYLLSAISLSMLLPLIKLKPLEATDKNPVAAMLQTDLVSEIVLVNDPGLGFWTGQQLLAGTYLFIVAILLSLFTLSLIRLFKIYNRGQKKYFDDHTLIKTGIKGTPFSFFSNIFWNEKTRTDTGEAQKMMSHELVHVKEMHSLDKLFANMVQIVFWFNPFFWMMKRELSMIHEFLADQKSFGTDARHFSAMTLQSAFPGHNWPANNSFFYSPTKRRLMMILKSNQKKVSYIGRLMALPVTALLIIFFSAKVSATETLQSVDTSSDIEISSGQTGYAADTIPGTQKAGATAATAVNSEPKISKRTSDLSPGKTTGKKQAQAHSVLLPASTFADTIPSRKDKAEFKKVQRESQPQLALAERQREQMESQRRAMERVRETMEQQREQLEKAREQLEQQRQTMEKAREEMENSRMNMEKQREQFDEQRQHWEQTRNELEAQRDKLEIERKKIEQHRQQLEQNRKELETQRKKMQ